MAHSNARNITIVVDQVPLSRFEVETKYMVVDLVRVLVEAPECVYLGVAYIGD